MPARVMTRKYLRWLLAAAVTVAMLVAVLAVIFVALVFVIEVVLQFQLFGQAWFLTGGGPNSSSRPILMSLSLCLVVSIFAGRALKCIGCRTAPGGMACAQFVTGQFSLRTAISL